MSKTRDWLRGSAGRSRGALSREMRIGVEIGGTKLQAALGNADGSILAVERSGVPAGTDAQGILAWFETAVPELIERARAERSPAKAIGIGFGGPVDSATGAVLRSHQVRGWDGFPLRQWFADRFELPVFVHNDSNAAGWAEHGLGAGRGTRHFCYMNIGSGIGGALVIDGKLHNGLGYGASEIGHTYVPDPFGAGPVKLEDRCSGWSIERHLREVAPIDSRSALMDLCNGDRRSLTCAHLGNAAEMGDAAAIELIDRFAATIGVALANVLALIHPERIAVGGGVGLLGDVLLNPIRDHLQRLAFEPYRDRYEIVPCTLGENVVLIGAMLLAQADDQSE